MNTQIARPTDNNHEEDSSRVPTPIASSHNARFSDTPTISGFQETNGSSSPSGDVGRTTGGDAIPRAFTSSLDSTLASTEPSPVAGPESANAQYLLPVPTPSSSRSQSFSVASDTHLDLSFVDLPSLSPELAATAEISIARTH